VIHSQYGDFLGAYWDTIFAFVSGVVTAIAAGDDDVRCWAGHIATWLPGFPGADQIFQGDNLARAVTSLIHTVSVAHTADHWIYHYEVDQREVPFRMRLAVPGQDPAYEAPRPERLVTWYDNVNYKMCSDMFFKPFVVSKLQSVDYGFESEELQLKNEDFLAALAATERTLLQQNRKIYVPLAEIACSVQF
jgi:hypothetical protein